MAITYLVPPRPTPPRTLMQDLQLLGYGANTKLCLDAGDPASWPGSGTKWKDTSGGGYDFFLGSDGSTDAPTFHGTAGALTEEEYWTWTNGNLFAYDAANEAWMNNLHHDGAVYTIFGRVMLPTGNVLGRLFSTYDGSNGGMEVGFSGLSAFQLFVRNSSGSLVLAAAGGTVSANNWIFFAVSVNEASALGSRLVNTSSTTFTSTYSSPSADSADALQLGDNRNSSGLHTGARYAQLGVLDTYLTVTELTALRDATKWRYGV